MAHWIGTLKCARQHSCPVCAARRASERRDELDRLMRGDPDGRWQMVTLTLSHHAGKSLRELLALLMGAFRKLRTTRQVRAIFRDAVTATVRTLEVTHGRNGWHPHIHLLLRTRDWSQDERATLEREWLRRVPGSLARAVVWSSPIEAWHKDRARYIAKMGAEVAGVAKECKNGNLTPWQVARRALNEPRYEALWREYQTTMKGRRVLEFDERAKALLEKAPPKEEPLRVWRIDMFSEEFLELVKLEPAVPTILWEVLETAIHGGPDPPAQVRITIDDALGVAKAA